MAELGNAAMMVKSKTMIQAAMIKRKNENMLVCFLSVN
ncbi:hypothetical protein BAP_1223 [Bacillus sp. CN2]|nr:hypothetical protein BAP_1223 [Bacillus sp. CN2]